MAKRPSLTPIRPPACPAADAGVRPATAGSGGGPAGAVRGTTQAGLRAQRRQALAARAYRRAALLPAGLSRRRPVLLPAPVPAGSRPRGRLPVRLQAQFPQAFIRTAARRLHAFQRLDQDPQPPPAGRAAPLPLDARVAGPRQRRRRPGGLGRVRHRAQRRAHLHEHVLHQLGGPGRQRGRHRTGRMRPLEDR